MARELSNSDLKLLELDDLLHFVQVAPILAENEEGADLTLNDVANNARVAASSLSVSLTRLEGLYNTVLVQRERRKVPTLTPDGKKFLERVSELLKQCRQLGNPGQAEVVLGATDTIRNRLLPEAVLAAKVYLQQAGLRATIRVVGHNHPTLLRLLREDSIVAAFMWEQPMLKGTYHDIQFAPLFNTHAAEFIAISPNRADVGLTEIPIWKLFLDGEKSRTLDLDQLLPRMEGKGARPISGPFADATVAVVETEPADQLREGVLAATDTSRLLKVNNYEQVLSCVRMASADFGWAPLWFASRKNITWRRLVQGKSKFTRDVTICRRFRKQDTKVLDKPIDPRSQEEACVLRVIESFVIDPDHRNILLGYTQKDGEIAKEPDRLHPAKIKAWVERNFKSLSKNL